MQIPFVLFAVDPRATAIITAAMQQWPHLSQPTGFRLPLFLDMLEERGLDYAARLLGMIALRQLRVRHAERIGMYDIFLPDPVGAERFDKGIDTNVARLTIDQGIRPRHLAVGLTTSGLMLNIATREADRIVDIGWRIPFAELHALGAATASLTVGGRVLLHLMALHPDAFAPYPSLSFQSPSAAPATCSDIT